MKWMIVASALMLCGCSMMESRQPVAQDVNSILNSAYQGAQIQMVMQRYGAPLRQMASGASTIYTWERDTIMNVQGYPPTPVHCQMDAYANTSGVVSEINVNGQYAACSMFL